MSEIMREKYCNSIEDALFSLKERLEVRISSNLTDMHIYSEAIMASILEPTLDLNLENANLSAPNQAAFDLVDNSHKVLIQVTSDASRDKLQSTLKREGLAIYRGYRMMFMLLVSRRPNYRDNPFDNPHGVDFELERDVLDISGLMATVRQLPIDRLERVYDRTMREIRLNYSDSVALHLGLAGVVRALISKDPDESDLEKPVAFRIDEKVTMNSLVRTSENIRNLAAYTYPLASIYKAYEDEGIGRVRSIFHHLSSIYRRLDDGSMSNDDLYFSVVDCVANEIMDGGELSGYTREDIEFYVEVVVVDAFMRCKLFDGPDVWGQG